MQNIFRTLLTLSLGILGGYIGSLIGLPSPWLLGSLLAVLLAIFCRLPIFMPPATTSVVSVFLGISIAANIDSSFTQHLADWQTSLILMFVMLATAIIGLYYFYRKIYKWTPTDALLSAIPGNLFVISIFAIQAKLSVERIVLVHSIRLFILVSALPLIFPIVERPDIQPNNQDTNVVAILLVVIFSIIFGKLSKAYNIPAGQLLGALIGTLILKFTYGIDIYIPHEFFSIILIILGASISARMNKIDISLLKNTISAALGGVLIALMISVFFAYLLHITWGIPFVQTLLAYMPGGLEVMIAIAFSTDVDPIFVATHQILRMIIVSLTLPLMFKFVKD